MSILLGHAGWVHSSIRVPLIARKSALNVSANGEGASFDQYRIIVIAGIWEWLHGFATRAG